MHYYDTYSYWQPRPTQNDFELEVISDHPDFAGRALKKYLVEGIESIGVYGDEPFRVHFHNRSNEAVQLTLSLDGTNVLTGKPASLEVNKDMWVVRAGKTLHLKAWAETNQGGARFVFTSGDKSVALHAHGDISHKGIISAAIFTERDRPTPITAYPAHTGGICREKSGHISHSAIIGGGSQSIYINNAAMPAAASPTSASVMESFGLDRSREISDFKTAASVGAGEQVSQKTITVKGLDHPVLNSIVRVRYCWWDDLKAKLAATTVSDPFPTGFPAEKIKTFADLSNVPRVESTAARLEPTRTTVSAPVRTEQVYDRVVG